MQTVPKLSLNLREAASATGLAPETIKRAILAGALPGKRSGKLDSDGKPTGHYLVKYADLETWYEGLVDAG